MQVSELNSLTKWIDTEIVKKKVVQHYESLQQVLMQNTRQNQQKQPFESQKDALVKVIETIDVDQLTDDQLDFLYCLSIAPHVGPEGIENIEDILFKNVIDIATAADKFAKIVSDLNQGISKSNQIKSGIAGCVDEDEEQEENKEIIMRVSFTGDAGMNNISDFKSWGGIWYDIGRGIAMAHNSTPEEIKVISARKGSIIIELAVACGIAQTSSVIILAALKVAEKVLDIRKKVEEIKALKLSNKKIANELEKEAEKEKTHGIDEITAQIIKRLGIKENGDGDKVNALDKSVKNLVNFIEKGGNVDFVIPNDKAMPTNKGQEMIDFSELKKTFSEIRSLESKLRLLEHDKS